MLHLRTVTIVVAAAAFLSATSPPSLAQGLGEYGAAAGGSGVAASFASTVAAIESAVRSAEPRTWIIASLGAVLVWFLFLKKR
jgi:hypothetical protein